MAALMCNVLVTDLDWSKLYIPICRMCFRTWKSAIGVLWGFGMEQRLTFILKIQAFEFFKSSCSLLEDHEEAQ